MSILRLVGDLARQVDDLVDSAASSLANRSDLERKLDEALSNKVYGVPLSTLKEIASETFEA